MSPDYFLLPVALILLIVTAISMEKRGGNQNNSWMHTFGCWTAIIIAVWMLTWWGFHYVYNHDKLSTWIPPNEFGDMFGALTCLFSGIAIAGVIAMLRQQHEEMKETRDEFAAQTEQFEEQTKQFQKQIELARDAQAWETFYRRVSIIQQLEASITVTYKQTAGIARTDTGVEAIAYFYKENNRLIKAINEPTKKEKLIEAAKNTQTHSEALLLWMKNVLQLLNYYSNNGHNNHNKQESNERFIQIFIPLLSPQAKALILLFSHALFNKDDVSIISNLPETDFPQGFRDKTPPDYYKDIMKKKFEYSVDIEGYHKAIKKMAQR